MSGFLYIVQCVGVPLYKVGYTTQPANRLYLMQAMAPLPLRFHRVLQVASGTHASKYESHILSWLGPVSSHGEWFNDLDAINAQFDEVAPAVDVTDIYGVTTMRKPKSRTPQNLQKLERDLRTADAHVWHRQQWNKRLVENRAAQEVAS